MSLRAPKSVVPWLCLASILILFLFHLARLRPVDHFGRYHDDTLYFSSAKALAEGRGYIVPSLPGTPPNKYPVLYPWLLSWIWRASPSFPANVAPAVWMTAAFACWFLIAAFYLLRSLVGVGDRLALLIVSLCAFQPHFLFFSGAVMSDIPFMAFALSAAVVADSAMRRDGRSVLVAAAGILSGLSVMTRFLGIAVVAGIFATAVYRRAYRQAAVFSLVAVLFLLAVLWPSGSYSLHERPEMASVRPGPGWRQTWFFYTNYLEFRKVCVPRLGVLLPLVVTNLFLFLKGPSSDYLFSVLQLRGSRMGMALCVVLTVFVLMGIVRQARGQEWKPIHFLFLFNAAITLLWHYPLTDRFLLLFLPLFYSGLWVEGRRVALLVLDNLHPGRPAAQKVLAAVLGVVLATLVMTAVWSYPDGYRPVFRSLATQRAALLPFKRQAYEWLRQNTDANTRIVAHEDANLFLYTGRQAVRPIAFSSEWFYTGDTRVLKRDLAHITDTAQYVGARFWVTAEDDFQLELGRPMIQARMAQLKSVLPLVFYSEENKVQVYDLSCVLQPDRAECRVAVPILFPDLPDAGPQQNCSSSAHLLRLC